MLNSLKRHCQDSVVYILCMDDSAFEIINALNFTGCFCVPLSMVENKELLAAKSNRNLAEYCWTLSSYFTAWLMENHEEIHAITYLDADLMFFSSPQPLFDEMKESSIGIIEHRFIPRLRHLESKGRFCVEWVTLRRDYQGLACLYRWREQCLEWCYDRLEDGRMGDQKYLDTWPNDYSRTRVLEHCGAGVAPWNYSNYVYSQDNANKIWVNESPLIFFHFHQFQLIDDGSFYRLSPFYSHESAAPENIYATYESEIRSMVERIRFHRPGFSRGMKSQTQVQSRKFIQTYVPRKVKEFLKRFIKY